MLLAVALLNLFSELTATADKIVCDGIVFHNVYFDKEILVADVGRPNNLVVHKFSETLFFSHTVQIGSAIDFSIKSCDIEKKQCKDIDGIPGGYAIAYDAGDDDIYFGGHNGIYKYNFFNNSAEFFAEEGKSIWGLFIRKKIYYIEYPTQKLFIYQNPGFQEVPEAANIEIDNFFVSNIGDVYFSNQSGLYKVEKRSELTIMLEKKTDIRQIVEDGYGDVYFCGDDGVYVEGKPYHKMQKIAEIDKAYGLTFDKYDHVIISNSDTIYRLMPSNMSHVCLNHNNNTDIVGDEYRDFILS